MTLRLSALVLASVIVVSGTAHAQTTLAEASAAAKKINHAWPMSANTVPPAPTIDPNAVAPVVSPTPTSADVARAVVALPTDEASWKARMRGLQVQLENDRTALAVARARVFTLQAELGRTVYVLDLVTVKRALLDAQTEASRWLTMVVNDTRAVSDLEFDAHRAAIPPGWLVTK